MCIFVPVIAGIITITGSDYRAVVSGHVTTGFFFFFDTLELMSHLFKINLKG